MEVLTVKILVIQTAFPGDAILTLPLIQKLKEENKNIDIDVLAIKSTRIIFDASLSIRNVITYDKKGNDRGIAGLINIIRKIRAIKYDVVYSPHRSARSALISIFSGAAERISFDKSSLSFLYTKTINYNKEWHEVRRNLSLYKPNIDEDSWKILPELQVDEHQKEIVENELKNIERDKVIAIAPGSVWETKKYPIEHFISLTKMLVEKNYIIFIIGGETDSESAERITELNKEKVFDLTGKLNFIESLYLLKQARLLISNDSAPTHLGVSADIPVLTIYCSTIPGFGFSPYNKKSKFISIGDLYCKPCGIHGYISCPEKHFRCGLDLSPNKVFDKALGMLEGGHSEQI